MWEGWANAFLMGRRTSWALIKEARNEATLARPTSPLKSGTNCVGRGLHCGALGSGM